jgi:TM2 domain-containing membrane protein YozV
MDHRWMSNSDWSALDLTEVSNKKLAAGLLGIFLGSFGIHKFVLGYTKAGLIMLLLTVLTCGVAGFVMGVIGLIEGIIYLTQTPQEFKATYLEGRKEWF